jgi:antitoxin component of RelBE/YafQ-DinJ toxin-antitoxin module
MSEQAKKGRGKPPGSLKPDAMRATLKLRISDEDLANAHRVADLLGEDISEFVRVAIRQRCKKTR